MRVLTALLVIVAPCAAQESLGDAVSGYLAEMDAVAIRTVPPVIAYVPGGDLGDAPNYTEGSASPQDVTDANALWSSFLPIGGKKLRERALS